MVEYKSEFFLIKPFFIGKVIKFSSLALVSYQWQTGMPTPHMP